MILSTKSSPVTLIRQCVGIDVSKADFTVCIGGLLDDRSVKLSDTKKFANTQKGFNQCSKWVSKQLQKEVVVVYVMEATGVYHEALAHHLHQIKKTVHVVLPNRAKHYLKSLNRKTKTDHTDAKGLAQFGVERKLALWSPPDPFYKQIKQLSRYLADLKKSKTMLLNKIEGGSSSFKENKFVLKSLKARVKKLEKEIKSCEETLKEVIKTRPEIEKRVHQVCTIKGLGLLSMLAILGETNGFELMRSSKQLVSFAGLDVVQRESGTSVRGRSRISKQGNSHIRRVLYFPAISASRYNLPLQAYYTRLVSNNKPKLVALIAVERKMLCLIYALWKSGEEYMENYEQRKEELAAEKRVLVG